MTRRPSHPGALLADILPETGKTTAEISWLIGVTDTELEKILKEEARITPEIAEKLGAYFGDGANIWLKMQTAYDEWAVLNKIANAEIDYFDYPIVYEPYRETVSYRCPCCKCLTLHERAGYEICPVCFWEDDGQDDPYADQVREGANGDVSLTQARLNYAAYGAMEERFVKSVRKPSDEEAPLPEKD